ncbi:MAG: hypothetical protein ISR58_14165, partial [Anaerolineales bacterium]|nr:hypothetical protein [Anaerolineales bacterium]
MTERHLKSLLGLEPSKWMMAPSERLAVLGLLQTIMPKKALEFGCADAGLTAWLSQYSDEVVTVDIDPKVLVLAQPFHNVTPLCMTTQEPADWAWSEGKHFDLAVIDADHSEAGVRRDLKNAMRFCDV